MNFRFWNVIREARTAKGLCADNIYFNIAGTTVLLADLPINDESIWTIRGVGVDHVLPDRFTRTPHCPSVAAFENARNLFGLNP